MNEKDMLLAAWAREFQITLKILRAYPEDKLDLKPHEVARSAKELAWVFVGELGLSQGAIDGEIKFAPGPPPPNTMAEISNALEVESQKILNQVKDLNDEQLAFKVKFPVGPGQMGDFRRIDMFWIAMSDMIHHRGQFSVYLRMSGAKVPSIYGPSHDEPWM